MSKTYQVAELASILEKSIQSCNGRDIKNYCQYAKLLAQDSIIPIRNYFLTELKAEDLREASQKYQKLETELDESIERYTGLKKKHEHLKKSNLELHEKYIKLEQKVNSILEDKVQAEKNLEQAIDANAKIYDDLLAKEVRVGKLIDLLLVIGGKNVSDINS